MKPKCILCLSIYTVEHVLADFVYVRDFHER